MEIFMGATPKLDENAQAVGDELEALAEQSRIAMGREPSIPILKARLWLHRLFSGYWFDSAIGCVILLNAVVVGIQVDISAKSRYQVMPVYPILATLETSFVLLYSVELFLRYFTYKNAKIKFSFIISVFGFTSIKPILSAFRSLEKKHNFESNL